MFYTLTAVIISVCGAKFGTPILAVILAGLYAAGWYYRNPWTFDVVSTFQGDFLAGVVGDSERAGESVCCGNRFVYNAPG